MIELVYKVDGREHVFPLDKPEIVLGRSPEADLSIDSLTVSRFHARIRKQARDIHITDLESRNKTKVNDVVIKEARLNSGDRIALGDFQLEVRERAEQKVVLADSQAIPAPSETLMRSAEEVRKMLEAAGSDSTLLAGAARPAEVDQLAKSNRILGALMRAGRALIDEDTLQGLLEKVMDLVFENIAAERGMLGLYEIDELVPKVVRYRREKRREEKIVIPKAITTKARVEKVSILSMDAQQEFDGSRSVLSLGIRSAICVPLWYKGTVIGIIYVDEDRHTGKFTSDDLDLLAALASYAAVAIERQRLTDRIQEEQATRAKLERYHSPGVVERILKGQAGADVMEMAEHEITVCFTDIVGFTSMSELMEPRQVGMAINELFTELTECIFRYEGTLDKYIGDCIMAVFGAPVAMEDHAVRCVRAAMEMQSALEKLNAEKGEGRPRMQLRVGINSGRAVAGDFGSPKRRDYSVLGDAVNQASRLESGVSQPGWIVIGEVTYEAVKDYYECQYLGPQNVKGRKAQIGAYRVLREKPGAFPPSA
jgi:adenylate cyclase